MRIGTWNVRTLLQAGKLENLKREMEKNNMNLIGVAEARWDGCGELQSDDYVMYYSGGQIKGRNGVGVIMTKELAKCVENVDYASDRVIGVRLKGVPKNVLIIQVYMPTSEYDDQIVEDTYNVIMKIMDDNKGCCKIVMGDWNAIIGEGKEGTIVGSYGLGRRNDRGERQLDFCRERQLIVANTWFKNHKRRLYTWKSPGDNYRNQIDFILVEERYRNGIKNAHTLPGADINSDHNLLMAKLEIKLKKLKKAATVKKWDLEKIRSGKRYRLKLPIPYKIINHPKMSMSTGKY